MTDADQDLTRLVKVVSKLEAQVESLAETVRILSERQNQPRDWIGMGMLLLAVAGGLGSFTILTNSPIKELAASNQQVLRQITDMLTERSDFMGYSRGQIERNERDAIDQDSRLNEVERLVASGLAADDSFRINFQTMERQLDAVRLELRESTGEVANLQGRVNALSTWVNDIDNAGSRRWNERARDDP